MTCWTAWLGGTVASLLLASACLAQDAGVKVDKAPGGIRGLAVRLLEVRADEFDFDTIPADNGRDVFELESRGDRVTVRGNSPLSQAVGLNWYLKYYGHCHVSLNGRQLNLARPLPPVEVKFRLAGWAPSRYLLNYCTFGYSMPWWDWAQWERFIDWMALNGVNLPLSVTGQEGVWQAVGRRFGMTEAEIEAFLAGPPYLPFAWMGCLDGHGGPLPRNWVARHVALQKQIVARERELGMTPVLQGFTGHLPQAIVAKFPGTQAKQIQWSEFRTWMLDPQDPLFQKLGAAFIEEQTRLFGTDHYYAADSFIEMAPPNGDPKYLAGIARAIYDGMAHTDPKAVWLLQGWPFMYQAEFWRQERIKAFLDAVPHERMLILDLFCEVTPVWNTTQGFYGKPWVWNFVSNFGNTTFLGASGPLTAFNGLMGARKHPLGHNLRGVGLMMEGYGHNPLLFDLMFELAWRDDVELKPWVREFARFRYGKENADAAQAWELLRTTIYAAPRGGQTIVTALPASGRGYTRYPAAPLAAAWQLLLQADKELGHAETYHHDLVNVARQALSNRAGEAYDRTVAAYRAKDATAYRQASGDFLEAIRDLDELLATNDAFLLGRWLEDAKRWGETDSERARLEWNARRVLTLWGTGDARDYAWKEWSGLLSGFYARRWEIFFQRQQEALDAGKPFDEAACRDELYQFEKQWSNGRESYLATARGDSVAVARRLYEKHALQQTPKGDIP